MHACVYVEKQKKPARKGDMRRQKYGSANLKYVKVKHEGSGRVVARSAIKRRKDGF